ncbi:unnamed protein product, partial [Candidula unifasciata]
MQQESNTDSLSLALKPGPHIAFVIYLQGLLVAGMYLLDTQGLTVKEYPKLVTLLMASGVFHVAYSYISTNIVLGVMNVVSHSIANIFKRLLVVLLLSALGTRQLSTSNYLGLGIAVIGLLVYTHGKIGADQKSYVEENKRCKVRNSKTWLTVLLLAVFTILFVHSVGDHERVSTRLSSARQRICRHADSDFNCLQEVSGAIEEFSHIIEAETDTEMREFLSWRLVDHPEDTDKRSKTLTTNKEIVEEAQRILVNLMQDLLGKAKNVMLIDIPVHENKGDPAIAAGEILLLEKLNKSIVFHCQTHACNRSLGLKEAIKVNRRYPNGDLVILMHGGGNIIGYPVVDHLRRKYIEAFPDRKVIIFSQSIWLYGNYSKELEFARVTYSNRSNLVIFLRDRQSLEIAKNNFKGVKLILAPDLAFCIGMIPRQMPPLYDIMWIRREDNESSSYTLPTIPHNITVFVGDWLQWLTNKSNKTVEDVFLIASAGFHFLLRGKIVVTDRLHGHILSTLLNIPH